MFLRQFDLAYIMKIKWMDCFWLFCKIDKRINNWFNYLERFVLVHFAVGKKNHTSRNCGFILMNKCVLSSARNLHSMLQSKLISICAQQQEIKYKREIRLECIYIPSCFLLITYKRTITWYKYLTMLHYMMLLSYLFTQRRL